MRSGRERHGRWSRVLALAVAIAVGTSAAPAAATESESEPLFVGWTAALPAITWKYDPTSSDDCVAGRATCVKQSIRQMERRLRPLADDCAHRAVFALAYLRTTEAYLRSSETPGFYADPAFVNHEAATFADVYFAAADAWDAGRVEDVPPAWRIAFRAAEDRAVTGSGDLMLGINAHVNRDLPFVLAEIGLVAPDASSRKPDHDRVNVMLNSVVEPLLEEEADRFDPSMRFMPTPFGVGYTGLMQTLLAWREDAWRHAELLEAAPDEESRALVEAAIEDYAATMAVSIVAATSYAPPLTAARDRADHCAAQAGSGG